MSQESNTYRLCILWENELRAAGKALGAVRATRIQMDADNDRSPEKVAAHIDACEAALQACFAAMYHLTQSDADTKYHAVIVGTEPMVPKRKAKR